MTNKEIIVEWLEKKLAEYSEKADEIPWADRYNNFHFDYLIETISAYRTVLADLEKYE